MQAGTVYMPPCEDGRPQFHRLAAPEDQDVLRLSSLIARRLQSRLDRRTLATEVDPVSADPLTREDPGASFSPLFPH